MARENGEEYWLPVPDYPEVADQIEGFYKEIGWHVVQTAVSDRHVYPHVEGIAPPSTGYRQLPFLDLPVRFKQNRHPTLSEHTVGWQLADLGLRQVELILPPGDTVRSVFERGGSLLGAHSETGLQEDATGQRFTFTDSVGFSVSVTSAPESTPEIIGAIWRPQTVGPETPPGKTYELTREYFKECWRNRGASTPWKGLLNLARQNPGFPLRPDPDEELLRGDVKKAIKWIEERTSRSRTGEVTYLLILRNIAKNERVDELPWRTN